VSHYDGDDDIADKDTLEDVLTVMSQLCWADPSLAVYYWAAMNQSDDADHSEEAAAIQQFLVVCVLACARRLLVCSHSPVSYVQ
jgi:hypothetical protein